MSPRYPASLLLFSTVLTSVSSFAGVEDLWITEVVPSSGEVEVSNVGNEPVTLPNEFAFCHRFFYLDRITSGTVFAAGESKVFTVTLGNAGDSDLWLYSATSGFGSATNLISGLKWGPAGSIGRTGLASDNGKWSGASSFVPAPAAGMALQFTGADPFAAENWSEGTPDLGNFSLLVEPLTVSIEPDGDSVALTWSGGLPPYQVRSSADLSNWASEVVTGETSRSFDRNVLGERAFFQVASLASIDETASYRIIFASVWSRDLFQLVPGGDHFSGLIGMTHNEKASLWRPGTLASPGIEQMAETGSKSTLTEEINNAIDNQLGGGAILSGGGLGASGSQTTLDFTASLTHPRLSIVSMIAPSPDWFVGVHDLPLIGADGDWVDALSIGLFPYDSGTDDGTDFTSGNSDSSPHVAIEQIAETPPFALKPEAGEAPLPLATFLIERLP
jgi:hypothetical protein